MAVINGHLALATLLAALAGGLDKPKSNWTEIGIRLPAPQQSIQVLDQRGNFGDSATPTVRKKISPADYFRIVELAPKAIQAPDALKEMPAGTDTLLHIKASDGQDYYFAADGDRFKNPDAQQISDILHHYQ